MKKWLIIAAILLAVSGCSTISKEQLIQQILDTVVPPDFKGGAFDASENVPMYVNFTLKAGGLMKAASGKWTFDWVEYDRNRPVGTSAHIYLGKRPQ